MRIKLTNAQILVNVYTPVFNGEVCIENGRIIYVGKDTYQGEFDRVIDCKNNLLMSSFCNAHSHAAMSLFRGIADDLPLDEWLFQQIFPLEAYLTPEDVYWGTMLQIAEFAKSGITAFADMYYYPESVYQAAKNANMAIALCCGANSYSDYDVIQVIEKNYNFYHKKTDRVRYFPGLHAEYTCEEKLICKVADFLAESGAKSYIHLAETLKEVGECTVRHNGLTPTQYLHKIGFFDNGGVAAHCVYVDKDDIALLKQSNIVPVINGASNLKLASGIAPVQAMLRQDLQLAIGTDGSASNNSTSIFKEMYLFSCLQKYSLKDAAAVPAEMALQAGTQNGFEALDFEAGQLIIGNMADIILIDCHAPNMQPLKNISKNIVYSADTSNILMTIAGGKIVYEYGKYNIGEEIDTIYRKCNSIQERLQKQAKMDS